MSTTGRAYSEQIAPPSGGEKISTNKYPDLEPMVWWCKSARRDEWAKSVLRRRKARLRPGNSLVYPQKTPEFRQFYAVMEWCRLWPKWNGGPDWTRTPGKTEFVSL